MKIYSSDGTAADRCIQMVTDICAVAEVGKTYLGKVVRIVDFGAFVEIFPGTDGLLHISEISENRIKEVRDELKEGDQILVKVLALEGNKIKLSRKAILKEQRDKLERKQSILYAQQKTTRLGSPGPGFWEGNKIVSFPSAQPKPQARPPPRNQFPGFRVRRGKPNPSNPPPRGVLWCGFWSPLPPPPPPTNHSSSRTPTPVYRR